MENGVSKSTTDRVFQEVIDKEGAICGRYIHSTNQMKYWSFEEDEEEEIKKINVPKKKMFTESGYIEIEQTWPSVKPKEDDDLYAGANFPIVEFAGKIGAKRHLININHSYIWNGSPLMETNRSPVIDDRIKHDPRPEEDAKQFEDQIEHKIVRRRGSRKPLQIDGAQEEPITNQKKKGDVKAKGGFCVILLSKSSLF